MVVPEKDSWKAFEKKEKKAKEIFFCVKILSKIPKKFIKLKYTQKRARKILVSM